MITGFDDAFSILMGNEGRFVDNPADPGGRTCWGITERVARANGYVGDMRDLPQSTAKTIAKAEYWDKFQCDQMPPLVAFHVFDTAYNGGHPVLWLQQAIGVTADGVIGAQTIAALRSANIDKLLRKFNSYRLTYYTSLKTFPTFGAGWVNRIANNLLKD